MTRTRAQFLKDVADIVELIQLQGEGKMQFLRPRTAEEVAADIAALVPEHAWSGVVIPIRRMAWPAFELIDRDGVFVTRPLGDAAARSEGCEATHIHGGPCAGDLPCDSEPPS